MSSWAYILRCADGRYYYGSTNDLLRRLAEHNAGRTRSTAWRRPLELVFFEECQTLEQARQREHSFKNARTRRKTIELLIATFPPERLAPFTVPRVKGSCRPAGRSQSGSPPHRT